MELNDTQKKALKISKILKDVFSDRIGTTQIYDVVHQQNHYEFKIQFTAYNYFSVIFQYELDIINCFVVCGDKNLISVVNGQHCYSDENLELYFSEVKDNLELRIPDKFLTANGWL